jgi:uncharacterized protein (DUF169 family)
MYNSLNYLSDIAIKGLIMDLDALHNHAEEMFKINRLRTYPFAVKMLTSEKEIPSEAIRPMRDLGVHLDLCQGFARTRWEGLTIAMLKEDMWCFEPVVGFGLSQPPEEFLNGENRFPASVMTRDAARYWAQSTLPRLPVDQYIGVISAPLQSCSFMPDIFVVYCDPEQLTHILIAQNAIDGRDVDCALAGHAACVYMVVPVLQKNRPAVACPCRGDRRNAMTQNNEIIFSAPIAELDVLMKALHYLDEHGWGYPWPFELHPERKLLDNYARLGRRMGMDLR